MQHLYDSMYIMLCDLFNVYYIAHIHRHACMYIYIYIYICNHNYYYYYYVVLPTLYYMLLYDHMILYHTTYTTLSYINVYYAQFSKFRICCCGLDPGNL